MHRLQMVNYKSDEEARAAANIIFNEMRMQRGMRLSRGNMQHDDWSMGNTLIKALFWFIVITFVVASCV